MQRVLRWAIPVDDQWHDIGAGYVVETSARQSVQRPGDLVEIWTLEDTPDGDTANIPMRSVTVVGTGHPVPENTEHVGTAVVPTFQFVPAPFPTQRDRIESIGGLVWHVFAKYDQQAERAQLAAEADRIAHRRADLLTSGVDDSDIPDEITRLRSKIGRIRDVLRMPIYQRGTDTNPMVTLESILWVLDDTTDISDYVHGTQVGARTAGPYDVITDWSDFRVDDVVVQNPAALPANTPEFAADFLVRRPDSPAPTTAEPNIGGYTRGLLVRIDSVNLAEYQGRGAVVVTLDHDHGWRLWIRLGDDPHDQYAPAFYVSPDDLRIP